MYRFDYIIDNLKKYKQAFIKDITENVALPKQKFLKQAIPAVLLSGSLVITRYAKWVRDNCKDIHHSKKRLLNQLNNKVQWGRISNNYRRSFIDNIQSDTPLIIDMTDIAKPRARKMQYIATVRDGSGGNLTTGYWCIEVYAHINKHVTIPLALHTYSIEAPDVYSENKQILNTIKQVNADIDGKGIWVGDRGFDRLNLYRELFEENVHFIIRQKGDRHVILSNGIHTQVELLCERCYQRQIVNGNNSRIIHIAVKLPHINRQLYLVAVFSCKYEKPLMLLTTMKVLNLSQAKAVIAYYLKRWKCEEAIEFLKGRIGFERFSVRNYERIKHLALLAMIAMGFLCFIQLSNRVLVKGIFSFTSKFRKNVPFEYYRLLDGLQSFVHELLIERQKPPEFL
jgi:hypothetical protein